MCAHPCLRAARAHGVSTMTRGLTQAASMETAWVGRGGWRALVLPAQACLRRGVAGPGPRLMKSRCVNSDNWDHARGMNTLNCTTHGCREPCVAQCIFLMPHLVWSQSPAGFGLGCGRAEGIARIALAILEHRGVLGPLGPTVRTGRARARTPNNRDPPGVRTHVSPDGASGASSAT